MDSSKFVIFFGQVAIAYEVIGGRRRYDGGVWHIFFRNALVSLKVPVGFQYEQLPVRTWALLLQVSVHEILSMISLSKMITTEDVSKFLMRQFIKNDKLP